MSLDQVTIKELLIGIIAALVLIVIGIIQISQPLKRICEILKLKEPLWEKQYENALEKELQEEP